MYLDDPPLIIFRASVRAKPIFSNKNQLWPWWLPVHPRWRGLRPAIGMPATLLHHPCINIVTLLIIISIKTRSDRPPALKMQDSTCTVCLGGGGGGGGGWGGGGGGLGWTGGGVYGIYLRSKSPLEHLVMQKIKWVLESVFYNLVRMFCMPTCIWLCFEQWGPPANIWRGDVQHLCRTNPDVDIYSKACTHCLTRSLTRFLTAQRKHENMKMSTGWVAFSSMLCQDTLHCSIIIDGVGVGDPYDPDPYDSIPKQYSI